MKFGCCAGIERLPALQRMGFDYIELNLSQLSSLPQEEYMGWRQAIDNSGLYAEAFNCMLPGGCALVGPGRDLGKIRQLLEVGFARAAQLGGKMAVLGSGGARRIPENMDAARAQEQLLEAVDAIGALAQENGLCVALEPLCRKETNVINSVEEACRLARLINRPNVRVLADLYHMYQEGEDAGQVKAADTLLAHVHIANPEGRYYPAPQDTYPYHAFFGALNKITYNSRVSLEANARSQDCWEQEVGQALAVLRQAGPASA